DANTHTLKGQVNVRYANRSPDTLRYVWVQLDQNIYREDSRGAALNPDDARFAGGGFVGGYVIASVEAVRRSPRVPAKTTPLTLTVNGTMGRIDLDRPLPPGGAFEFAIAYSFQVPEHGSDRMGREHFSEGWLYEM